MGTDPTDLGCVCVFILSLNCLNCVFSRMTEISQSKQIIVLNGSEKGLTVFTKFRYNINSKNVELNVPLK